MPWFKNHRKLKGRNKLMLVTFSGLVVLVFYFISYSHYLHVNKSRHEVLDKLKAITCTASLQISGELHEKITEAYTIKDDPGIVNDSIYDLLHEQLGQIQSINKLQSPVYTMIYNEDGDYFELVVTSADEPYYRHAYKKFPVELLNNYEIGGTIDTYEDEHGSWLSAFAPIRNADNEVVGLVQSDENFDEFLSKANASLLTNILMALVLLIPFTIFLYSFIKSTFNKEERDRLKLEEQNEEIQIQNETIRAANMKLESAKRVIEKRNQNLDRLVKTRTRELLKSNSELQTFLYRSSHDILGPIATLRGLCHLASSEVKNLEAREYIDLIGNASDQLNGRIRSINAVYEIKNRHLRKEAFKISEMIENIVSRHYRLEVMKLGINLDINVPEDLYIHTDKSILRIITSELIKNAIQYRDPLSNSKINISVESVGPKAIKLVVEDNGIGINPGHKQSIFRMFKRGHERSQGAGLGLYSIKLALKRLHGKIELISKNAGVRFQLYIPNC